MGAGKGSTVLALQAWKREFDSQNPRGRREQTTKSCPLTSKCTLRYALSHLDDDDDDDDLKGNN